MKRAGRVIAGILILLMVFMTPIFAGENLKYINENDEAKFFNKVASDLVDLYEFDITKDELLTRTMTNLLNNDPDALDSFLRALFSSLDEYSEFYLPEEYKALTEDLENITGGIGVQMVKGMQYAEIVNVIEGSPAEKAGVKIGDAIVSVNGENMVGKGTDYISSKVRGEIGTELTLTVFRNGENIDIKIVRGELTQNTIEYGVLGETVGYLGIQSFSSRTDKEVDAALAEFDKVGIKKIIIDLRYNPGGYIDSAINIAKHFVPQGTIITHHTKYGNQDTVYTSDLNTKKYELVTLVNEYTASAAELLASSLQESGASKLIGKQTYGKAVTQAIFGLYGGRMCKVTSGEYITRNGNKINKIGLKPDYNVKNIEAKFGETDAEPMKFAPSYNEGDVGKGILAIKQRLNVLGYDVGGVNEEYGESMKYAVEAFQTDMGLEITGIMDINTQIYLADKARDAKLMIDYQAKQAFDLMGIEFDGYMIAED